MIALRAGVLVQVTRTASPQFVRPILFRLIRVRTEWITYDGGAWLDGYQIDAKGDAVARRSSYVQPGRTSAPEPSSEPPRAGPHLPDRSVAATRAVGCEKESTTAFQSRYVN